MNELAKSMSPILAELIDLAQEIVEIGKKMAIEDLKTIEPFVDTGFFLHQMDLEERKTFQKKALLLENFKDWSWAYWSEKVENHNTICQFFIDNEIPHQSIFDLRLSNWCVLTDYTEGF